MGLHAAIVGLSSLIHEGEQRYIPYIVGDPRMVSLSVTPPLKNPGYAPALPFYVAFLTENWYFFPIPAVKKWYSFHIPSISFNC